ncbi:hypothetical protein C8R44DRAFT_793142 [Mycena epipterygia]|nr:hypothetical protein C8R44DRAFT_793142 [Mycena epipterygia]
MSFSPLSMYRSSFPALPSTELHIEGIRSATSPPGEDPADTVLNSATTLLPKAREGSETIIPRPAAPKESWHTASSTLRIWSLILHSLLLAIYLTLVGVWAGGLEHRVTVGLQNQKVASFLVTASTTAFGTIYSALLVLVTQTLSMRRSLQLDQALTATHDNSAAWAGLGAAILHLWKQRVVPAPGSMFAVLSAAVYLSTILGLHITTSSLFSVATFNPSRSFVAGTLGLPAFKSTPDESGVASDPAAIDMDAYASGSLYFLPSIFNSTTSLGLQEGTLYDVLDLTVPSGYATVNATGFNVTCGFLPDMPPLQFSEHDGYWTNISAFEYQIYSTAPGIISRANTASLSNHSIVLYSTIPILDSGGNAGTSVDLSPAMNSSVSSIQIFQCSMSLVSQTAVVDAQSRQIQKLEPDFQKTASTWMPYTGPLDSGNSAAEDATTGNAFIDWWGLWYSWIPVSDFQLDYGPAPTQPFGPPLASIADVYLIQTLNLPAANHSDTLNVTLHDVENALSVVVASMFWTLGHIPPTHRSIPSFSNVVVNGTVYNPGLSDVPKPPILLSGNAIVNETYVAARLELSIISVSTGLAASVTLILLSLLMQRGAKDDKDLPIDGTGMLHSMWLYRNHPELETLLENVEHPTDDNLRAAGMVRTRLVGARLRKQRSCESL